MKSIFARTYIVIAVLIFVSLFATIIIVDNLFETTDSEIFIDGATLEAKYIEAELRFVPESTWNTWIEEYQSDLGHIIELVTDVGEDKGQVNTKATFSGIRADYWSIRYPLDGYHKSLIVSESDGSFADIPTDDWLEILIPIGTIFLILAFGILYLARRITKPIGDLVQATQAFTDGNLNIRVAEDVSHPVDNLAIGFNEMATRLQELVRDQQVLIGALPHELRSPLGRIRFALDTSRNLNTVDALRVRIEKIDSYVDELYGITEDVLTLIQLQNEKVVQYHPINLKALLEEVCRYEDFRSIVDVSYTTNISQPIHGNTALIRRALANLVDNACRYAKTKVEIQANQTNSQVQVTVSDDGPGIESEYRDQVFTPFSRIDESRSRKSGGVGLGLALVDMIMKKHQGSTTVTTSPWGGAQFTLTWS